MPIWPGFNEGDENDINFIKKQLLQHLIFKGSVKTSNNGTQITKDTKKGSN